MVPDVVQFPAVVRRPNPPPRSAIGLVETAGGPLRYAQAGEGPDVVLIHGAITSLEDMLLGPFDALATRFRVTAFDRPGHGESPRARLEGAPLRQVERIREAVRGLGLERPVVVGQSFGATLALDYAVRFPDELAAALVISPIAYPEIRLEHLLFGPRSVVGVGDFIAFGPGRLLDAVLLPVLWRGMFAPQPMPERFRREYPFAMASGATQMLAMGEEAVLALPDLARLAAHYQNCRLPVGILAGDADIVALPFRHAGRLAGALSRAEFKLLPGLGHMLHHFAVDEVVAAVERLASRSGAAAHPRR